MALNEQIIKLVECAHKHDCASQCVTCLLSFNHIVEEPMQLDCGHLICKSCKPSNNKTQCKNDNKNSTVGDAAVVTKFLLDSIKNDLLKLLKEKFQRAIAIFESNIA